MIEILMGSLKLVCHPMEAEIKRIALLSMMKKRSKRVEKILKTC